MRRITSQNQVNGSVNEVPMFVTDEILLISSIFSYSIFGRGGDTSRESKELERWP